MNTSMNVNSLVAMNDSVNYVEMCNKCLELEAELIKQHNMVEKDEYNRLSKSFSELEQHCISLELAMQLNKEIFQKNNTSVNQTEPSFDQLFELKILKAELQAKDTTIKKLKSNIKRLNKTSTTNNVKKDINAIETINIELEHRVTKLITENEHLKQTYKQLFDSIKPSRVRAKEHTESLVNQLNQKSVEITDLNAQIQEKVFVIKVLKNDLRKIKGKDIVNTDTQVSKATIIAPRMYKLNLVTLAPKEKNNRETRIYYLKHTMEQAAILKEIVKQAKSLNPLDNASYSSCKYVKMIHELLGYVRDTCLDIHKPTVSPVSVAAALRTADLADSPVSTWTKDHTIANVIRDPSCSVSTIKQLQTDAMWCYFDAFLTSVKPKNFKQAMIKPSWIDAMQEEIHEFERLQVWELVLCPDKVMLIKLKWIYKVKTDEFGGVLKNKARLVAQGFRLPTSDSVDTPMVEKSKLDEDLQGKPVDATLYHGMIESLMISGKEFDEPPSEEEALSFIRELGHSGKIKTFMHTAHDDSLLGTMRFVSKHADTQVYGAIIPKSMTNQALLDSVAYKTYFVIASGAEPSKSRKSQKKSNSTITYEESPSKKKSAKAKKVAATKLKPTKKKAPVKADIGKGLNVLSKVALSEAAQLKEATKRNEGTGTKPRVPDVLKYNSKSDKESWGDSGEEEDDEDDTEDDEENDDSDANADDNDVDDDDNDANDDDNQEDDDKNDDEEDTNSNKTESDRIKILVLNQSTMEYYKEEEEKVDDEEKMDEEMMRPTKCFLRVRVEQVEEDAHVTLTPVLDTQKTYEPVQSFSVSYDFTSKLLNLENPSLADNEIASLMDTTICHEEPGSQTSSLNTVPITTTPTITFIFTITIPPPPPFFNALLKQAIVAHNLDCREEDQAEKRDYIELVDTSMRAILKEEVNTQLPQILPQAILDFATPAIEKNVTKSLEAAVLARELYDALVKSYQTDKDLFDTYGEVFKLKRIRDDIDKDQEPSIGSDRRTKKRKSSKEAESSRDLRSKEKSLQAPLKRPPILSTSLLENLPMQRSQVIQLMTWECNMIKSSTRVTMMNNPLIRRLPRRTGSRNPNDLQLLILIGIRDNMLTFDLLIPGLVKFLVLKNLKLTNLTIDEWYDLNVALCIFTRWIVIQKRVEDLQLGVECYQKKLYLTKPATFRSNLKNRTTYTAYSDPKGVIYKDQNNRNRLMHTDELYKFSDGTLNDVRTALHDIAKGIRMKYLPKRK
nr:integrase, catalytic region, zinc finger, CCHC-type, peptidase aspartic, catalytic [Tanacetum cinerariifolium]